MISTPQRLTPTEKSWILYDVANSAFTLLISTILPIFSNMLAQKAGYTANQATAVWSYLASLSTLVFVVAGPILGALADHENQKKKFFLVSLIVGVAGCLVMGLAKSWVWFLALFFLAKVGYNASLIFYDSMLTDVCEDERMDRVSSMGYAFGYLGSCLPFLLGLGCVLLSQRKDPPFSVAVGCLLALCICAAWWALLSLPLLRRYRQCYFVSSQHHLRDSFRQLGHTLKTARQYRPAFLFLLAFFFYIDGVYTIIEIATPYGISMGIGTTHLLLALLLTQLVAFPFALLFGRLSARYPTRRILECAIVFYLGITLFAFQLNHAWEFWLLAVLVGMVQGGIQALSRSYFAKLVPKEHSNEFFGFYDIFGKSASVLGTFIMGLVTHLSDRPNLGILPISVMFLIGLLILRAVPVTAADRN